MSSKSEVRLGEVAFEPFGVFEVKQLTRGTALDSIVAADWVKIAPGLTSQSHCHQKAETVLWIVEGHGTVTIDREDYQVKPGDRLAIGKGLYHRVRTNEEAITFLSVQVPPILDKEHGLLDLVPAKD